MQSGRNHQKNRRTEKRSEENRILDGAIRFLHHRNKFSVRQSRKSQHHRTRPRVEKPRLQSGQRGSDNQNDVGKNHSICLTIKTRKISGRRRTAKVPTKALAFERVQQPFNLRQFIGGNVVHDLLKFFHRVAPVQTIERMRFGQNRLGIRVPLKKIIRRAVQRDAEFFDVTDFDKLALGFQKTARRRIIHPKSDQKRRSFLDSAQ